MHRLRRMSDRNFFAELKGRDFYDVAGAYALVPAEYFGTETFSMCMRRGFLFFALSACFALTQIKAGDWSEHLTLHEDTQSPDGSYGIVVSTSENEQTDYFADQKTHRLLGKIEGFDYVEGQFHGGLSTV